MDVETLPPDIGAQLLKIALGVVVALLAAIIYNFNDRIMFLERERLTPDGLKEALREVLGERKR